MELWLNPIKFSNIQIIIDSFTSELYTYVFVHSVHLKSATIRKHFSHLYHVYLDIEKPYKILLYVEIIHILLHKYKIYILLLHCLFIFFPFVQPNSWVIRGYFLLKFGDQTSPIPSHNLLLLVKSSLYIFQIGCRDCGRYGFGSISICKVPSCVLPSCIFLTGLELVHFIVSLVLGIHE